MTGRSPASALGGAFLGWLLFADQPRPEAAAAVRDLAGLGLDRQVLLTGDRAAVARRVGGLVGIAEVEAEALPRGARWRACWPRSPPGTARWWWATASTTRWR